MRLLRSKSQRERDRNPGLRNACCACGQPGTKANPLKLIGGSRIHGSHQRDPRSGFYTGGGIGGWR